MPPRPARLPSVPRPDSARAANAGTPVAWVDDSEPATAEAINHGDAASSATPRLTAAHAQRGRPDPGAATLTSATTAARISPVGVRPANANHNGTGHQLPVPSRNRSTAVATHGRQP